MRLAHCARHLYGSTLALPDVQARPSVHTRSGFHMMSFLSGDSLEAVIRRLSTYESVRQYSPVRTHRFMLGPLVCTRYIV